MIIRLKDLRIFLVLCFLLICIFFPGDPYGLKIIFFAMICISGAGTLVYQWKNGRYGYIYLMGMIFPIILMIFSSIIGGNIVASISGAYPAFLLLLVITIVQYDINYERMLFSLLQIMVIFTLVIVLLDVVGFINVNEDNFIRNAFYTYDMGVMGKSSSYAVYYKVFFKSSPLLILLLPYCFEQNKFIMAILTFVALILSGTRANIFVAAVVFVFGFINIWSTNKKNKAIRLFLGVIIVIYIIAMISNLVNIVSGLMNTIGSINSDLIRTGQLASFKKILSNPSTLLFGMGFGTSFYDLGRMAYTYASEIAYLDLLRKIGLIWFITFIIFLMNPIRWHMGIHMKIAYLGYLLICFTNPLLFSSTAYVLYIYVYYRNEINKEKEISEQNNVTRTL